MCFEDKVISISFIQYWLWFNE